MNDIVNGQYLKWHNRYRSQLHFPPSTTDGIHQRPPFSTHATFWDIWRGHSSSAQSGGTISVLTALIKTFFSFFFFHQTLIYFAKFYLDTHHSFQSQRALHTELGFSFEQSFHGEGPDCAWLQQHASFCGPLTYTRVLGLIQTVSFVTVAGVALGCVVTDSLTTNVRADLALVHLWDTGRTSQEKEKKEKKKRINAEF